MKNIAAVVCNALLLLLVMAWTSQARALTEQDCATQGFANVVAPYRHEQPLYDGAHHLDVYVTNASTPGPLIVYIHGGGWSGTNWPITCYFDGYGNATGTGVWLLNRLPEGFTIASVEYTEAKNMPVPPTLGGTANDVIQQVREIKYAIRWLKSRSATYRFDPSRVIITGGSAGGHLSALTALTEGETLYDPPSVPAALANVKSNVQYVFAYAGIYDIATYSDPLGLVPQVFGCWSPYVVSSWRPCSAQTMQQGSPVNHINASDPKVYVLQGDQDTIVPPQQANEFKSALCAAGRLSYYNLAISGGGTLYQHNLEPFIAANPYQGIILMYGLSNSIMPNC